MKPEEARAVIVDVFRRLAPAADIEALDSKADFRDQLDVDSMDLLNVAIGIHERTGVDIPEADYGKVQTPSGLVAYLVSHS